MNTKNIIINGRTLQLLEYVPEYYCYISDIANKHLSQIRQGIKTWVDEETYNKMNVSIWVYNDLSVNAFANNNNNENYIALSVGLLQKFFEAATEFVNHEHLEKVIKISVQKKDGIGQALYLYMLSFIIAHEFGHIAHGHLLLGFKDNFVEEIHKEKEMEDKENNWYTQLLEYDADSFAAMINTFIFLCRWTEDEKALLATFDILFLSFYLSFSVLANESKQDFSNYFNNDIDKYNHPHPGIRMFYSTIVMFDTLISNRGVNDTTYKIINSGIHLIFAYEKEVLEKSRIKDNFFSICETERGVQHTMNLINGRNELVDELNNYSYIPIHKTDNIDAMPYSLDENGLFIQT